MRLLPICAMLALFGLSACQSAPPPDKMFTPACTQHRYDAGYCDLPTNFHAFATLVTGQYQ